MSNQHHLIAKSAKLQRLDHPLGSILPHIKIDHQNRPALLQRFGQFQRQRARFH